MSSAVSSSLGLRARVSQSVPARVRRECPEKLANNALHVSKSRLRCVPVNRPRSLRVLSTGGRIYHTIFPSKLSVDAVVHPIFPTVQSSQQL